ncbi:MAG TPA: flagellar basal body protein FliL [Rhodospirillales bacterium]|nr:flagellar basal body protein FliL [Rhodospirillales bacterium]
MAEEELEEEPEGEDGEEASSSGGKKKLLIIVGAVVLLLIGAAAAVFFSGILDSEETEESAEKEGKEGAESEMEKKTYFVDLDEMIVNLNTTERRQSLLKIKVSLEVAEQKDVAVVQELTPRVVDNFQTYLRELRLDDLRGSAGMYRLREELLTRINIAVEPAKVKAVLFKEMIVQ